MNDLVVIGGGGHAKVLISIIRKIGRYRLLGYTDLEDRGPILDVPFLGNDSELSSLAAKSGNLNLALGVGQVGLGDARRKLWEKLQGNRMIFPTLISPAAVVNEGVSIAEGAVVFDGAVVNVGACLGRGAIANTNSTIEHDVLLDDWVHVGPGSTLSGGVHVRIGSMIGAGAVVIEGKKVASGCIVGAGACVVCDLTEPGVYVGVPARRIH